ARPHPGQPAVRRARYPHATPPGRRTSWAPRWHPAVAVVLAAGPEPGPSGATGSVLAVYQPFATADGPVAAAIENDVIWQGTEHRDPGRRRPGSCGRGDGEGYGRGPGDCVRPTRAAPLRSPRSSGPTTRSMTTRTPRRSAL